MAKSSSYRESWHRRGFEVSAATLVLLVAATWARLVAADLPFTADGDAGIVVWQVEQRGLAANLGFFEEHGHEAFGKLLGVELVRPSTPKVGRREIVTIVR